MKDIHIHRNLLVVLVLLLFQMSSAVQLDRRGRYSIVIALKENTPQPNNTALYLENIKKIFQDFSIHLYTSTKQKFFIESIDLIIPPSWENIGSGAVGFATSQSYGTADIRIVRENFAPRVENPNACGTPGNFIELPLTYFDKAIHGNYGSPGKALVSLWARYRFGVWEEHGYPDDFQFPYVYQKPSLNPVWSVTGCSNTDLQGKFVNRFEENCTTDSNGKPEQDCKFNPSSTNIAISSLLHFPWLYSVTEFCDLRTHNYAAPNRQNFLCGHRSAWDIIKEAADYRKVNGQPVEMVPLLKYNILTVSKKPLFYVLIDNGRSSYPLDIIRQIMISIGTLYHDLQNIASLGSFPNIYSRSNSYVTENVPWTSASKENFTEALEDLTSNDGAVVRDFGAAILEVTEQIKRRNHEAGAVILVVKRGVGVNTFDRMTYEQEVVASLHEQTNIRLLAIELQENEKNPYVNLNNLVKSTEGEHLLIADKINVAGKLSPFIDIVKALLKGPIIPSSRKFRLITKQFVHAHEKEVEIPVLDDGFDFLQLHVMTSSLVRGSEIELKQLVGEATRFEINENKEWDENVDARKRTVHTFTLHKPPKGSIWSIKYSCPISDNTKDCTGFLVAYGSIENSTENSESDTVDITVSTSAIDGFVDMSRQEPKPVPFSVYAKVEIDGQPVLNIQNVQAIIRLSDNSKNWKIPLLDDGSGNPDISVGDGVYSNVFTPSEDGLYRISVIVRYHNNTIIKNDKPSGIGRLLPINQDQIGCYNSTDKNCFPAKPTSFLKISDLPGRVTIENCATFRPGRPMKITDFEVTVLPNFGMIFSFTSPKLLGMDNSPQEFQIFMAPSANNYLGTTEQTKLLVAQIGEKPGTRLHIPYVTLQTALPYYTVEAIYDNMRSGPSNIVGVNTGIPSPTPTTTPRPSEESSWSSHRVFNPSTTTRGTDRTSTTLGELSSSSTSSSENSKLTIVQLTYIIIAVSVLSILITAVASIIWKQRKCTHVKFRSNEVTETRC